MLVKVLGEMCAAGLILLLNALKSAIMGKGAEGPHRLLLKASMLTVGYIHPSLHLLSLAL